MSDRKYVYLYDSASGSALNDCCYLGLRFLKDEGIRDEWCESWVTQSSTPTAPGKLGIWSAYGVQGWMTGLWCSPKNHLYVTSMNQRLHICRNQATISDINAWEKVDFKSTVLSGVWGYDDNCVFVWTAIPSVLFWNGSKWRELPAPPEKIVWMHGSSPENIYAVGYRGLVARWDGHKWKKISLPTRENFTSVFVAGPDEIYAVGHGAVLWAGSAKGWVKAADAPGPLFGVAKFADEVWVGAKELGLHKLVGNKLKRVSSKLRALMMDARKSLLITCEDQIAATTDGKVFSTKGKGALESLRGGKPALFAESQPVDVGDDVDSEV